MVFYNQLWVEILIQLSNTNKLFKYSKDLLDVITIFDNNNLFIYSSVENIKYLKKFIRELETLIEKKLSQKINIFLEVSFKEISCQIERDSKQYLENWSKKPFYLHSTSKHIYSYLLKNIQITNDENLYYLWGNEGIGKTHLIIYLLNQIKKTDFKFLYLNIFDFSNKFYKYFKFGNNKAEYINKFLEYNLIVFDDFYLIKNRENIGSVIYLITKQMVDSNKKVIFINTCKNNQLTGIDKKISGLIQNSTIFNILEPKPEDVNMIIYLFFKQNNKKIKITTEAVKYLSSILGTNLSTIIDRLMKIFIFFENPSYLKIINIENLKKILEKMSFFKKTQDLKISSNNSHLKTICKKLNLDINEITSNSRKKNIVLNRDIVIYIFKKKLNFSHESIGEILNKNHSTISHSLKKIELKIQEKSFKDYFDLLLEKIF